MSVRDAAAWWNDAAQASGGSNVVVDVVVIPTTRPPVPQAMLQPMPERVRLILDLEPAEGPIFGHLEQPGDGVSCDFRGYVALIAAIEDARRAVPSGPAAEVQGDGP